MERPNLLKIGIAGSIVTAVCCFTPVLVFGLGALGLGAWLGWIDYVLLPMLGIFLGVTAYELWRRRMKVQWPPDRPDRPKAGTGNELSAP